MISATRSILLLIACCALLSFSAVAQTTGSISGTVNDEKGAVIPGASVTVRNIATNDSGTAVSPLNRDAKDRVHAIGPEFGVLLPAKKFNFVVRVLPEFAARSRTRGVTFVASFGKTF